MRVSFKDEASPLIECTKRAMYCALLRNSSRLVSGVLSTWLISFNRSMLP